jgi:hypothetical protein
LVSVDLKVRAIGENPKVALIVDTGVIPYKGSYRGRRSRNAQKKENVEGIIPEIVKKNVRCFKICEKTTIRGFVLIRYPRIPIKVKPETAMDI